MAKSRHTTTVHILTLLIISLNPAKIPHQPCLNFMTVQTRARPVLARPMIATDKFIQQKSRQDAKIHDTNTVHDDIKYAIRIII